MNDLAYWIDLIGNMNPDMVDRVFEMGKHVLAGEFEALRPYIVSMMGTITALFLAWGNSFLKHLAEIKEKDSQISEANANRLAAVEVGKEILNDTQKLVATLEEKHSAEIQTVMKLCEILVKDQPLSNQTLTEIGALSASLPTLINGFMDTIKEIAEQKPTYEEALPYTETLKEG